MIFHFLGHWHVKFKTPTKPPCRPIEARGNGSCIWVRTTNSNQLNRVLGGHQVSSSSAA